MELEKLKDELFSGMYKELGELIAAMIGQLIDDESKDREYKRGVCDALRWVYLAMLPEGGSDEPGTDWLSLMVVSTPAWEYINSFYKE